MQVLDVTCPAVHVTLVTLVHGGVLAVIVDEVYAKYSNRGTLTLYLLTKYLGIEFEKLSLTRGIFIIKVSISRLFLLTASRSRKVLVKYEILVL
jgi:hypothetical protein